MRSIRQEFPKSVREEAWARCGGRCEMMCQQPFNGRVPHYHHRVPAALGGANTLDNCQVGCTTCHRIITREETAKLVSKAKTLLEKRAGIRKSKFQWPKRKLNTFQRGA